MEVRLRGCNDPVGRGARAADGAACLDPAWGYLGQYRTCRFPRKD
jgi:hypothetical protein